MIKRKVLVFCHGVSWGGPVNIAISAIAWLFCSFGPTCSVLLRAAIVEPQATLSAWTLI